MSVPRNIEDEGCRWHRLQPGLLARNRGNDHAARCLVDWRAGGRLARCMVIIVGCVLR
jgi:hypothetical protein